MKYFWLSDAPLFPPPGILYGILLIIATVGIMLWAGSKFRIGDDVDRATVPPNHINDPEDGALTFKNIFGDWRFWK